MVMGVVASLELLSSNKGEEGWADSTARYWHTARAAAYISRDTQLAEIRPKKPDEYMQLCNAELTWHQISKEKSIYSPPSLACQKWL